MRGDGSGTDRASGGRRIAVAALLALACLVSASVTQASPTAHERTSPATLSRAGTIRNDVNARIRVAVPGAGLAVTEATSTDAVDSFTLLSEDLLDARFVPARGGVLIDRSSPSSH